jgi:hypothetical protein
MSKDYIAVLFVYYIALIVTLEYTSVRGAYIAFPEKH